MCSNVQLHPYVHQVTGHAGLLTTEDQAIILKPLIPNELDFYICMAPELRPFTPTFFGVTEVTHRRVNGNLQCTAELPLRKLCSSDDVKCTSSPPKQSLVQYEGIERRNFEKNRGFRSHPWTRDKDLNADMSGVGKNPWAARLLSKTQNKLLGQDTCLKKSFVLLENVAGNFTTPCILDLKVGTRLYGDDCPSDKIQRHYEKDKLSTTSSLGVRLSGMQVYQNSRYVCRDKFFGRGLSETGFYHSLRMFLHDGIRIRTEVIAPILLMLENVIVDLNTLTTYRLYGASLIIMYEGVDYDVKQREKQHCLRYDHSQIKQQDSNKTLSKFYSGNPSNHQESSLPSSVHTKEKMMATVRRQSKVDVRIVDFAHCTTSKLTKCIKHHSGPDAGFIFGLKNLVKMLKQIEEEEDV